MWSACLVACRNTSRDSIPSLHTYMTQVNDPRGVTSCSQYGESFLLLRNVRLRTSFANEDTGGGEHQLARSAAQHCGVWQWTRKGSRSSERRKRKRGAARKMIPARLPTRPRFRSCEHYCHVMNLFTDEELKACGADKVALVLRVQFDALKVVTRTYQNVSGQFW